MPKRLRDVVRVLKAHGIEVTPGRKHFQAKRPGDRVFTIPAHNALKTEITEIYLKAMCRHFGLKRSDLD